MSHLPKEGDKAVKDSKTEEKKKQLTTPRRGTAVVGSRLGDVPECK